jgi:hypothetical protein
MRRRLRIVHVGWRDAGGEQPSGDIHEDMALQSDDFLAAIVSLGSSCFPRLHRLTVDHARRRGRFTPLPFAVEHHQKMIDPFEQTSIAPSVEMALNRAVGRKAARERPPLAACSQKKSTASNNSRDAHFGGLPVDAAAGNKGEIRFQASSLTRAWPRPKTGVTSHRTAALCMAGGSRQGTSFLNPQPPFAYSAL